MSNVLGGAFCPGGEASWIMRNSNDLLGAVPLQGRPLGVGFP